MRPMLHALVGAAALAMAPGCTLDSDGGPDDYGQGPWVGVDAGPAPGYPDAATGDPWPAPDAGPGDPWPVGDAGSPTPWPDAGPGDPWPPVPDAGPWTPWPDAGPGDPWPDAGPGDPWPDAGPGDPWPNPCADIASEAVCIVTQGCNALYQGINCQCYADGTCTCDGWEFDRCE